MANADASPVGLAEHELYGDDVDSEEEEDDEVASTSGNGKQNGVVSSLQTDRFGFIGGDQYTDPER